MLRGRTDSHCLSSRGGYAFPTRTEKEPNHNEQYSCPCHARKKYPQKSDLIRSNDHFGRLLAVKHLDILRISINVARADNKITLHFLSINVIPYTQVVTVRHPSLGQYCRIRRHCIAPEDVRPNEEQYCRNKSNNAHAKEFSERAAAVVACWSVLFHSHLR
jgi:hypothetical protein